MELKNEKNKEIFNTIIQTIFGLLSPSICQLKFNNHFSIGVLCNVYVIDFKKYYSLLLTPYQSFEYSPIEDKTIEINFHDNKGNSIVIDDSRFTYTSLEYGIAFFQIKDEDNLDKTKFLKVDQEMFNKDNQFFDIIINLASEEFMLGLTNSFEDIFAKNKNNSKLSLSNNPVINLRKGNNKIFYEGTNIKKNNTIEALIESTYIKFSDKIRDLIEFKKNFNFNEKNNKSMNRSKSMDSYGKIFGLNLSVLNENENSNYDNSLIYSINEDSLNESFQNKSWIKNKIKPIKIIVSNKENNYSFNRKKEENNYNSLIRNKSEIISREIDNEKIENFIKLNEKRRKK